LTLAGLELALLARTPQVIIPIASPNATTIQTITMPATFFPEKEELLLEPLLKSEALG
jgi:hypothetical protein